MICCAQWICQCSQMSRCLQWLEHLSYFIFYKPIKVLLFLIITLRGFKRLFIATTKQPIESLI